MGTVLQLRNNLETPGQLIILMRELRGKQGVSIHYITSIHYISNWVVVVVHYIFRAILVVVVNTNILSTITPLHLFVRNWMKMTFLDIFNFENLRHLAVVNELRLIFILIQ